MTPEEDRYRRYKEFNRDRWSSAELYAGIFVVGLITCGALWWQYYKFCECRQVGHGILYCLASLF